MLQRRHDRRVIGIGNREVDHLGAVGRDRQRGDDEVRLVGLQHRNARRARRGHDLQVDPEILGEKLRSIDVRSGRLQLVISHAERGDGRVDGDPDLARLLDVVERIGLCRQQTIATGLRAPDLRSGAERSCWSWPVLLLQDEFGQVVTEILLVQLD